MRKKSWLFGLSSGMRELGPKAAGWEMRKDAEQQVKYTLLTRFITNGLNGHFHSDYTAVE